MNRAQSAMQEVKERETQIPKSVIKQWLADTSDIVVRKVHLRERIRNRPPVTPMDLFHKFDEAQTNRDSTKRERVSAWGQMMGMNSSYCILEMLYDIQYPPRSPPRLLPGNAPLHMPSGPQSSTMQL